GARPDRQLLNAEVGGRHAQVEAGGSGDRPQGVVRGDVDVVRLAPARDLPRLRQAADDAQVDPRVVDQLRLDQLAELPLGGELLAGGNRRVDVAPQLVERGRVLAPDRVLDEVG